MNQIQSLKQTYNLMTGDQIQPPRPKPIDDHGQTRVRWSTAKKHAFREMRPAALCIVATDGPVSVVTYDRGMNVAKRYGHNRGCWPMRIATTAAWEDNITGAYDRNPFVRTGVQIRTWCSDARRRDRLVTSVTDLLGEMSENAMGAELENGFTDAGPDVDLELFEVEIHAIAERLGFGVWDDAGLSAWLDEIVTREEMRKVGAR